MTPRQACILAPSKALLVLRQGTHGGGRVTFLLSGCVVKVARPDLEKRSPVMTDGCAVPPTPVLGATRSRLHPPCLSPGCSPVLGQPPGSACRGIFLSPIMTHFFLVPGGGDVKIESQKLNFKEKAQAKVGSLDNVGHLPAGGAVKVVLGS